MTTSPVRQSKLAGNSELSVSLPASQNAIKRPIWEVVVEIGAQISDEEWDQVPSDASINYRHYLYGAPKQDS